MKTIIMATALLFTISTGSLAQTKPHTHKHAAKTVQKYTCSMHPEVVRNKPGKCPKCGMDLVAVKPAAKKDTTVKKKMDGMKM